MKKQKYFFPAITGWALMAIFAVFFTVKGSWNPATANPPGSNALAPINVGSSNQTKSGNLSLGGTFTVASSTTFQSPVTLTPLADSTSLFKITNATGTEFFKIDSVNNTSTLSAGGTSLAIGSTGASVGNLSIGSTTMNFGATPGGKFGIGVVPTTYNLEVAGTTNSTGNIKSDAGFCIGASCITEWPSGGGGGGDDGVPQTSILLSQTVDNSFLIASGYLLYTHPMGAPYTITAMSGMGNTSLYLFIKN